MIDCEKVKEVGMLKSSSPSVHPIMVSASDCLLLTGKRKRVCCMRSGSLPCSPPYSISDQQAWLSSTTSRRSRPGDEVGLGRAEAWDTASKGEVIDALMGPPMVRRTVITSRMICAGSSEEVAITDDE